MNLIGMRSGGVVPFVLRGRCPSRAAEVPALNPGLMDYWITDQIVLNAAAPESGNSWDHWITDQIPLRIWSGRP